MKEKGTVLVFSIVLLLSLFLSQNLPAEVNRVIPDTGSVSQDNSQLDKAGFARKTRKLQMPFIANNGQMDEQVRFYAKTFGGTVFVTKEGEIVYSLPSGRDVPGGASQETGRGHEAWGQGSSGAEAQGGKVVSGWHGQAPLVHADAELVVAYVYSPLLHADNANCPPDRVFAKSLIAAYLPGLPVETTRRVVCPSSIPLNSNPQSEIQNLKSDVRGVVLREQLVGAKIGGITGEQPAVTTVNYFTGNDQSKWKTNVPTYNMVNLGEVYKGIELSLKAYSDNVEKLFCVKPGASPEFIKVQIDGGKSLRVNQEGQLEVDTELGLVKFTRPIAYQEIAGKRIGVDVEYRLSNPKSAIQNPKSEYGFTVASYDKTKDLIIDPLLASTCLGETVSDGGYSLTLDTSGNVYVTGYANSSDFPTTSGAYDTSHNGDFDVFVSKLDNGLTILLASTFLGGSGYEAGKSLTLDTSGNVYVTGVTESSNFPTTSGAYDTSFNGGRDVFVSKLNSGLTSLLSSAYLGGSGNDYGEFLSRDTSGNVYVTGYTESSNFPTTSGAYDTSYNRLNIYGGNYGDVFVSKLNSGLTSLLASTFLGGTHSDYGNSLTLDTSGNVYVTGTTWSTDFPTTSGAYDTSFNGGYVDVFVSKLNSGLTSLQASTYLGGSGDDNGSSLALDTSGNVYVTGDTDSSGFPATVGAYDTSFNGAYNDVFVSKLDGNLSAGGKIVLPLGTLVTNDLWIRAVINTEDKGPIEAVWKKGGESTNARGDRAIWGHFYASPNDESWGSANNPDLYVKIWYDVVEKRWDVNYFHVSVPDIEVYSQYPYGTAQQMRGVTTMNRRYIRQYYKGGYAAQDENYEDGLPATGYYQGNKPTANNTINSLSIGSTINTEEKGPVSGVWRLGGTDTTARGDQVVWGFFYANPGDVSWGNQDNPDLYVKIWFDVTGRIDVNFFHVSVPEIEAYSGYPWSGSYMQKGTTIMADRYILQQYQKVGSCTYSISPTSVSSPASGSSGSVDVTTGSGCSWSAGSNVSWITVSSGSNGKGNGKVAYSVQANTSTNSRTGTMTIAGKTFTVTQNGSSSGCKYEGTCNGRFGGDDTGRWNATIYSNCSIYFHSDSDNPEYPDIDGNDGNVDANGKITLKYSEGTVDGNINLSNNTVNGTWKNTKYGLSGTFDGVFTPKK